MNHQKNQDHLNYKIILTCLLSVGIISLFYFLPTSDGVASVNDSSQSVSATDNMETSLISFEENAFNFNQDNSNTENTDTVTPNPNEKTLETVKDDRIIPAVPEESRAFSLDNNQAPVEPLTQTQPSEPDETPEPPTAPEPQDEPKPKFSPAVLKTKEKIKTFSAAEVNQLARRFYGGYSYERANYSVEKWAITFTTRHENNRQIQGNALAYIPVGNGPFPIMGSAAGTTGIDDACAPSRENVAISNWGDYEGYHTAFAGQGYAVVFPDYSGFNDTDGLHHYFVADLQAKVVLDSLKAIQNLAGQINVPLQDKIYLSGYSQGAHSILAAADLWKRYAPELPIAGLITYGAANNTVDLLLNNSHLGPYLVYAYEDFYGEELVDRNKLLQPRFANNLDQDYKKCVGEVGAYYGYDGSRVYTPELWSSLKNGTVEVDFPRFHRALSQNISGYGDWNFPTLILQGATDRITPPDTNQRLLSGLCADNKPTTYRELASTSHVFTRQRSFNDTLTWIDAVNSGENFPNTCTTL